jgi:ferric-dicitrate binding protein FerR (iron transport regulator)
MKSPIKSPLATQRIREVRRVLRILAVVVAAAAAGWATWSIHAVGHPRPAAILGGVAALAAAKLLCDITRRGGKTN